MRKSAPYKLVNMLWKFFSFILKNACQNTWGSFGSGIFMMAGGGGTIDGVRGLIARWGSNAFTIMRWRGRLVFVCPHLALSSASLYSALPAHRGARYPVTPCCCPFVFLFQPLLSSYWFYFLLNSLFMSTLSEIWWMIVFLPPANA